MSKNLPILTLFLAHFDSFFLREKKSSFVEILEAKISSTKISSLKVDRYKFLPGIALSVLI